MAELLVRVHDKVGADLYRDCQCTKRGDVIVVCPDGHVWGEQEKRQPFWRILRFPRVAVSQASTWLSEEPDIDPRQPSRTRRRRLFRINLDALPVSIQPYLADDRRSAPSAALQLRLADLEAVIERKAPILDPAILGEPRHVL